jgi:hypothetical protein
MNERGCSCRSESMTTRDYRAIAPQSCATCRWCGRPGHTRRRPGPLATTGAWCDRCYAIVEWTVLPQMLVRAAVIGAFLFMCTLGLARVVVGVANVMGHGPVPSCAGR